MKPGNIVRRKTKDGKPIGPYMVILSIDDERVFATTVGPKPLTKMYLKSNLYVYTCRSLYISKQKLELLKKGDICVQHPSTPRWQQIFDKMPELVRLVERSTEDYAVFVIEYIKPVYSFNEKNIRIVVNTRVL